MTLGSRPARDLSVSDGARTVRCSCVMGIVGRNPLGELPDYGRVPVRGRSPSAARITAEYWRDLVQGSVSARGSRF